MSELVCDSIDANLNSSILKNTCIEMIQCRCNRYVLCQFLAIKFNQTQSALNQLSVPKRISLKPNNVIIWIKTLKV